MEGLRLGLERRHHHPQQRQQHHGGERREEQVPGVERQEAPARAFDHPGLAGQLARVETGSHGGGLGDGAHEE